MGFLRMHAFTHVRINASPFQGQDHFLTRSSLTWLALGKSPASVFM